jgi:apolipoprotein D and lipocalin family protein
MKENRMRPRTSVLAAMLAAVLAGCSSQAVRIPAVAEVDVPRFMGDWYVIAHIPSRSERNAYDAVESYALRDDGRIQTTFRYRDGGFDRELRTMEPIGTVRAEGNGAVWDMQFVWPIQAEYVIVDLDADYTRTIVGRSKRDYVWLMAREPVMADADYEASVRRIAELGYDVGKLRRVPQSPRGGQAGN